jgi:hypothetical protein
MIRIPIWLCVLMLLGGCIRPVSSPAVGGLAACPVTPAPQPAFVPPPPYPAVVPAPGEFWYGTADLWTVGRDDGVWRDLPYGDTGYRQKIFWWRQGYNGELEPEPKLTVTGERLDGPAPPLLASRATNAYHSSFHWAMLVGVDIPIAGCWEITGQLDDHTLSFVIWVEP